MIRRAITATGAALSLTVLALAHTSPATAGATIKLDDTRWISLGAGLRTSFNAVEHNSPSTSDYSKDFQVDNFRIYLNAQVHEYIKFEGNLERDGNRIRILDAVAKFEIHDLFNVWVGRFLPPSDRANLDGPFYLNQWEFPFVQAYPAIFAGRDNGAAVWGQVGGGRFKYQVGVFEGVGEGARVDGSPGPNQSDHLLYAGRLTVNLLDPEPGYYTSSTYFGEKDILAIAAVLMYQEDAAGTASSKGDFTGWNVDALFEKNFEDLGVFTLEGAYYDYHLDGKRDFDPTVPAPPPPSVEGESWFVLASHLFPWEVRIGPIRGKLKPLFWYQDYNHKRGGGQTQWELGLHYIIAGHNARIAFMYGNQDPGTGFRNINIFRVGIQLQI